MYQAQINYSKSPIVFYISSGPGCATTISSFFENGPYMLYKNEDDNYILKDNP